MEAAGTWTLLLALLLLLLLLALARPRTRGHLPPGPPPLPLLGNLLQLRPGALYSGLLRLSKKYGPVFTVYLGPWRRVVVLVGHEAVQEALGGQAEEFSGRGMLATLDGTFGGHGVFFSNGERWRQLRRLTTLALRDLGMGKREGEELIQAEAQRLVEGSRERIRELGAGRAPGLGDRARLPYTDAVLHEAQRLLALVPMGVPRALARTTCFRGYTLPQGTEVFPLLGSVLHDPEIFDEPEEFNPDRFLDADGRFQKQEAFLPFSLGKRICLGEGLAHAELFLLLTTILQAFSLESPSPPGALSLQPAVSGLFNIPPAFQLRVRPH
uniref:Cytochrome P450 family 2 subfamily S member 1 n=1 Tax=Canis lupus familiaris TaxID=9615 RepID=A0A8I3MHH7_CANLF